MAAVVNFVEKQRTFLVHDYLVYICGVEVSRFISDLTITYNDRNAPNSADFTVTNAMDQFILTYPNLVANRWRLTADRYTEIPKHAIYQAKRHLSQRVSGGKVLSVNPTANLPEVDYETGFKTTDLIDANKKLAASLQNQDFLERYAFGIGSCIFSRFDTVRVFLKNPYVHQDEDKWIPFFTGTIQNKPVTTDYVTGESRINISAMDVRAEMAGMRVATNFVQASMFEVGNSNEKDQRANSIFFDSEQAGFFKDLYIVENRNTASGKGVKKAQYDNIFANKGFVDMASMLVTGLTGWVPNDLSYAQEGQSLVVAEGRGVGFFKPGEVIRYGNAKNESLVKKKNFRSDLEEWDNLCLFGVSKKFFTRAECDAVGRASFWYRFDTNVSAKTSQGLTRFTPFDGHMHFLMPAEGLKIASMIVQSFEGYKDITKNPDWTNRFELLTRLCQLVDYEWSVTGNGDIVFEFPMYDFYPESFKSNSSIYVVDKHLHSDNIADESGEIPAAIEATADPTLFGDRQVQAAQTDLVQSNGAVSPANLAREVVVSPILASKYGAKIISHTFTGVPLAGLKKAATIELQKRWADANKLSFDFTYRPYIRPNRPLLHQTRARLGKTTSVSYNIPTWPSAPSSGASVHCVRTPLFRDGKNVFQHITGAANMPLSYNAILENAEINTDGGATILENKSTQGNGKAVSNPNPPGVEVDEPIRSNSSNNNNPNWTRFDHLFQKYGAQNGIDWQILKAISLNETQLGTDPRTSRGLENPDDIYGSRSSDGKSWGIMQMRYDVTVIKYDKTAKPQNLNDPDYSVKIAAQHLKQTFKNFDSNDPRYLENVVKSYGADTSNADAQAYWERFNRNLSKVQQG